MKIYKLSNNQKIVSFDFDNTIYILDCDPNQGFYVYDDSDTNHDFPLGHINHSIVSIINQYNSNGWKCICVTSRNEEDKKQVQQVIKDNNLPITEIYCTNGQDKVFKLKELGVSKHYDDSYNEIQMLKRTDIIGIQV